MTVEQLQSLIHSLVAMGHGNKRISLFGGKNDSPSHVSSSQEVHLFLPDDVMGETHEGV